MLLLQEGFKQEVALALRPEHVRPSEAVLNFKHCYALPMHASSAWCCCSHTIVVLAFLISPTVPAKGTQSPNWWTQ